MDDLSDDEDFWRLDEETAGASPAEEQEQEQEHHQEGEDIYAASKFGGFGEYMRHKRAKLQIQDAELGVRGGFFSGLRIYIDGYTRPSQQEIREMIVANGGMYMQYLESKGAVTHIIAMNLTPRKRIEFQHMKVCTPSWIVDSVAAGRLLRWQDYLLDANKGPQKTLAFAPTQASGSGSQAHVAAPTQRPTQAPHRPTPTKQQSLGFEVKRGGGGGAKRKFDDPLKALWTTPRDGSGKRVKIAEPTPSRPKATAPPSSASSSEPRAPPPSAQAGEQQQQPAPEDLALQDDDEWEQALLLHAAESEVATSASTSAAESSAPAAHVATAPELDSRSSCPAAPAPPSTQPSARPPPLQSTSSFGPPTSPPPSTQHAPDPPTLATTAPTSTPPTWSPVPSRQRPPSSPAPSPLRPGTPPSKPTSPAAVTLDPLARGSPSRARYAQQDSNADARRLMQDAAWRAQHTARSADFLDGYYANSRLHYLSTSKEELKLLVAAAQEKLDSTTPGGVQKKVALGQKKKGEERVILHVDMDCFFASASLSLPEHAHLRDKPVVVCHSRGGASSTSEIASCNYLARSFGIKNGMSLGQARQLCASVQTVPYEFEHYRALTVTLYKVLLANSDRLQAVSVDEALLDVTERVRRVAQAPPAVALGEGEDRDPAKELAEKIRAEIRTETGGCEASVGISHNVLLARLATRHAKPAGSFRLCLADVQTFLAPLAFDALPGVGREMRRKLEDGLGVRTVGELRATKRRADVQRVLGQKLGATVWDTAGGVDERAVEVAKARQSVSAEVNYGIRFESLEDSEKFMRNLAGEVAKRMKAIGCRGRAITLKVMTRHADAPVEAAKFLGHGIVDVHNRSAPLTPKGGGPTSDAQYIFEAAWRTLKSFGFDPTQLRGLGLQVTKLEGGDADSGAASPGQGTLSFKPVVKKPLKAGDQPSPDARPDAPVPALEPEEAKGAEADVEPSLTSDFSLSDIVIPTQLDPAALEGLPDNIRTKILAARKRVSTPPPPGPVVAAGPSTRAPSPPVPVGLSSSSDDDEPLPSQVDASVWKELPPELRAELRTQLAQEKREREAEASRKKAATAKTATKATKPSNQPRARQGGIQAMLRPVKPADRESDRSRSRSRSRTRELSPTRAELVGGLASREELARLNIDPEVFEAIPLADRRQVLQEQRRLRPNAGPRSPTGGKRGKSRSAEPDLGPRPVVRVHPPLKLYKREALSDILDLVGAWIEAHAETGPAQKDLQKVAGYVLACVDRSRGGVMGLENATSVLKLWRRTCLERFGQQDKAAGAGAEWWAAFVGVKGDVDEVVKKEYGGALSLG